MNHRPINEYGAALLSWLEKYESRVDRAISIVQISASQRGFSLVRLTPNKYQTIEAKIKGRQVNSLWGNRFLRILSLPRYQNEWLTYYTISDRGREALEEWRQKNNDKANPIIFDNGGNREAVR